MQTINIRNKRIHVVISTKGAEIQSIRDENSIEYMWQGDPAYFASRAPILFPVAGGFREDCYELNGKRYTMPKHGFVRYLDWQVEKLNEYSVTMLMKEKSDGFPFDYELRAVFMVFDNKLSVSYIVSSQNETPFYFSIGAHEAYTIPERLEDYEIEFEKAERLESYPLHGNLTLRTPTLLAANTKILPLKSEYFAVDALVFRSLDSRSVTLRSNVHERTIQVDFPEHTVLMLWTKPGAGYICIEPWCNGPDYVDAAYDIKSKPGFMRLEKGETITRTHIITIG